MSMSRGGEEQSDVRISGRSRKVKEERFSKIEEIDNGIIQTSKSD